MQSDLAPEEGDRSSSSSPDLAAALRVVREWMEEWPKQIKKENERQHLFNQKQAECRIVDLHLSSPLLDIILALRSLAPRQHGHALLVQRRHDVVPVLDDDPTRVELGLSLGEHVGLNGLEQSGDGGGDVGERKVGLLRVVSSDGEGLILLQVLGSDLETKRDTLRGEERIGEWKDDQDRGEIERSWLEKACRR